MNSFESSFHSLATPLFATPLFAMVLLALAATPAVADDYLMYAPSLAVHLQGEGFEVVESASEVHAHRADTRGCRGGCNPFVNDESHFAIDAGHTVTLVDEAQWRAMTTAEFAAYDAIVIGDAGCDFDSGSLLDPLDETKATWAPAVTGHLFLHSFDPTYHYNQNSTGGTTPEQFQAMVDLVVKGMEYAASGGSTGLFYGNGCRSDLDGVGGAPIRGGRGEPTETLNPLRFFSLLATLDVGTGDTGGDEVEIVDADHPAMLTFTETALSDWSNSYHAHFENIGGLLFDTLAIDPVGNGVGGDQDIIILATRSPLGSAILLTDDFEAGTAAAWSTAVGLVGSQP